MSYILDALQRADAERERGGVPGLHARPALSLAPAPALRPPAAWRPVATLLLALLLMAVALWVWRAPADAAAPQPASPAAPMPAASPPPVAVLPGADAPPLALQAVPTPERAPVRTVTVAARSTPSPLAPPATAAPARAAAKGPPRPGATEPRERAAPAAEPPVVPAAAPGATLRYSELPEPLRRQIPALSLSGAVYAESTQEWILLVNDRLVTRGSLVAPEVRLEEVGASSAVFSFRGTRFRVEL